MSRINVLVFAADDLRPQLGCYEPLPSLGRHVPMSTPHIDELAARDGSVIFTNSYCQEAICGPSRASLLTGRRPDTTNVHSIGPYAAPAASLLLQTRHELRHAQVLAPRGR
jgi:iduronate 2-sulfatase